MAVESILNEEIAEIEAKGGRFVQHSSDGNVHHLFFVQPQPELFEGESDPAFGYIPYA